MRAQDSNRAIENGQIDAYLGAACVVDLDNILNRGFDKKRGAARPQAQLDILRLAAALREHGVTCGTICRNRDFPPLAEQLWGKLGFRVIAANKNCDDEVIEAAKGYAYAGVSELILVAGDSDYVPLVTTLRARGIRVQVWSRRATTSKQLVGVASRVRDIDSFLTAPAAANTNEKTLPPAGYAAAQPTSPKLAVRNRPYRCCLRAPQLGFRNTRTISTSPRVQFALQDGGLRRSPHRGRPQCK